LRFQPSIIATSDAGAGVGYTGIRIRGSDATRTNITINGIPLNDAESQGVFWVNMPDFASSVNSLYIQRGVGTSTNGAGAFGASVNIQTEEASDDPFAEINNSYGSFNTWKHNVRFGTGKIGERVSVAGRLSKVTSDGFIDRAFSDLKSFFVTGKYEDVEGGHELEANIFSGQEQTYQAWYGVPEAALEEGNRTLNVVDYENETDNYQQDHYQLIYTKRGLFGLNLNANAALHYTYGRGYFEQYRADDELADYGISPVTLGDTTVENSDLIRRRWLDNDFYGIVYNLNYYGDKLDLHLGGGWNRYEGAHFGEVIWAEFASNSEIRERYYDNDATKTDFNTFLKATYEPVDQLSLFADLQIRQVNYEFLGFDNEGRNVTQDDQLTFFNPKFGARFTSNAHQAYLSYAVAHREPNRNDYTESTPRSRPNPEVLRNVEAGYSYSKGVLNLFGNFYYMNYKDQLVVTGAVNDVGAYTRQNVAKSYRLGVELGAEANWEKVSLKGNLTLSRNKIQEFTEFLDDFDNGGQIQNTYTDTDIAFSPSVVGAAEVTYRPAKGLELSFLNKYVGEQFLDNTQSDTRKIDAYFVSDLRLQYQFKTKPFKNVGLNLLINNIFDIEYEANGYTFGYLAGGATTYENFFFPQAGTNFLLGLQVRF
ncbi:MAG: TonB-dependent receptor, partial [Bacteroidota bacterium]